MRIMGNEDGMGSVNRGALMEIGPARPTDLMDPSRDLREAVPALDAKAIAQRGAGQRSSGQAREEARRS